MIPASGIAREASDRFLIGMKLGSCQEVLIFASAAGFCCPANRLGR